MFNSYAIEIRNLQKNYGVQKVLEGVFLTVAIGEVVSIIGSSGSGKSTLLRCINSLEEYDKGEVLIDNHLVGRSGPVTGGLYQLPEGTIRGSLRKMHMVFQQPNLWPHMSVLDNIATPLRLVKGMDKREAYAIAEAQLERVGLTHKASSYPNQLAGGQQQRVAIARALGMEPNIILFDEQTSDLDPELVDEVLDVITDVARSGMTLVIVTHEMGFATKISDKVVFLANGRIEEQGPPSQIFEAPSNPCLLQFLTTWNERQSVS